MIQAYRILTAILYPFLLVFLFYRKLIKKEDPQRFKEKILVSHFNVKKYNDATLIWFHAASIGEFKSIIPIIKQLISENKKLKFLITTTTISSGNLAKIELKKFENIEHRYFPLDINFLIEKFLLLWKPDKIFLVDSEIWPNLILKAKELKIPIALINARLTSKSFNKWLIFPNVAKKIFQVFELFLCSNIETKNNLERLNLKNVFFKGNIKLIEDVNETKIKSINDNVLSQKRFWFAASTHEGEDDFCLKTHIKLKEEYKDIITIIAPRHINRITKIQSLSEKYKLSTQILNENDKIVDNKEIIIINYFGALKNYFKFAKSVFIRKSMLEKLKDNAGQNPIEAAKLNCKIYHGPYVYNFEEIYQILEKIKISKKIHNFKELSNNLITDLRTPKKEFNQVTDPIKSLAQKTMIDTMKLIDNFIYNDN